MGQQFIKLAHIISFRFLFLSFLSDESTLHQRYANGSSASSSTRYPSHPGARRRRRHVDDDDDDDDLAVRPPVDRNQSLWWCVMLGLILIVFGICSVYGMKVYMEYLERIKVR